MAVLDAFVMGGVYEYTCALPAGCQGARYLLHREILDVPSYQRKLLVEALDGKDAGLWFCCTIANFSRRYRLAEAQKNSSPREIDVTELWHGF